MAYRNFILIVLLCTPAAEFVPYLKMNGYLLTDHTRVSGTPVVSSCNQCDVSEVMVTNTAVSYISMTPDPKDHSEHALLIAGYIITPCMLVFGLFGNCMTFIIMQNEEFRFMPSSLVLRVLALSDTSVILMWSFNKQFMMDLLGNDVRALSRNSCSIFFWFWKTSKMTSSWFIVLISIERFIAVVFAFQAHSIITKSNALLAILVVYLFIGGYNMVWECLTGGIRDGHCMPNVEVSGFEHAARPLLVAGNTLYAFAPGMVILVLNTVTLTTLVLMAHRRLRLTSGEGHRLSERVTVRMTGMLLGISFAFLILVVPIGISHIVSLYTGNDIYTSKSKVIVALREITQAAEMLNYSINFFLYVMCCGKFRQRVLQIMKCHGNLKQPPFQMKREKNN